LESRNDIPPNVAFKGSTRRSFDTLHSIDTSTDAVASMNAKEG